jgi:toxin ParE1/3/4
MSLKVVILESAEYDLKELRDYIVKNFSLETWLKTYGKIKKATYKTTATNHLVGSIIINSYMLIFS